MFYLLMTGEGEGCDYTIACNRDFCRLKAETWEAATEEALEICDESSEPGVEKAEILIVSAVRDVNLGILRERREKAKKDRELAEKRKQLDLLKRELGE